MKKDDPGVSFAKELSKLLDKYADKELSAMEAIGIIEIIKQQFILGLGEEMNKIDFPLPGDRN